MMGRAAYFVASSAAEGEARLLPVTSSAWSGPSFSVMKGETWPGC
jgi:hypothetical protein